MLHEVVPTFGSVKSSKMALQIQAIGHYVPFIKLCKVRQSDSNLGRESERNGKV